MNCVNRFNERVYMPPRRALLDSEIAVTPSIIVAAIVNLELIATGSSAGS